MKTTDQETSYAAATGKPRLRAASACTETFWYDGDVVMCRSRFVFDVRESFRAFVSRCDGCGNVRVLRKKPEEICDAKAK